MIEPRTRLSDADLAAVAALEREVVAVDGGRLKIEWEGLRHRSGDEADDLLWVEAGRVLGFVGLDVHGGPEVELVGAVVPDARGRGIGTALLAAAADVCRARGFAQALLIVPRGSRPGHHLARRAGAPLHHCEHAMRLTAPPAPAPEDPRTTLRAASAADLDLLGRLLAEAFGAAPERLADLLGATPTLVVEHDGEAVGTLRLSRADDAAGVYGFAITPSWQGRGLGRDVLRRVCRRAFAEGARHVHLEVAVGNERALGLYTSVGFTPVAVEDYYDLPL